MRVGPDHSGSPIILHHDGRVYELIAGSMFRESSDFMDVGGEWKDITETPLPPVVYPLDHMSASQEPWIPDLTEEEVKECCDLLGGMDTGITLKYEGVMRDILIEGPLKKLPRMPVSTAPQPRYGWRG